MQAHPFLDFNAGAAAAAAAATAATIDPVTGQEVPGIPTAMPGATPGTPAFDMAAASLMTAMPGFDPAAWAGIAFPSFMPPPSATGGAPDLAQQLKEAAAAVNSKKESDRTERGDKVDRKKAPQPPPGGDVLRLRGLPWSAGPSEVAQFLHEYGIRESNVTMCVTESGRQDGHAWVVFDSRDVSRKAMQEKQRQTIGGRFIELFQWKDHSKEKAPVATTQKVYHGVLKHFDAQRKAGYIFSMDAEADIGRVDIYAFKDVLERGKASVGDTIAFPLHWSPKGQPQASSPLIRIASAKSFAHTGTFKLLPAGPDGKQGGSIECVEMMQVFGKGVYVSPSLAASLVPGSLVAFNAYLTTMPAAFAKPPLDAPNVPVVSRAQMVDESFDPPGPDLEMTKTAPGFENNSRARTDGMAGVAGMPGMPAMPTMPTMPSMPTMPAPAMPSVGLPGAGMGMPGTGSMGSIGGIGGGGAGAEICRFFAQAGWCKYGEGCRHRHIQGETSIKEPCQFFAKAGWCKFGDGCRHAHIATGMGDMGGIGMGMGLMGDMGGGMGMGMPAMNGLGDMGGGMGGMSMGGKGMGMLPSF